MVISAMEDETRRESEAVILNYTHVLKVYYVIYDTIRVIEWACMLRICSHLSDIRASLI